MLELPHFAKARFNADQISAITWSKANNRKYTVKRIWGWQKWLHNNILRHILGKPPLRKTGFRFVREEWGYYCSPMVRVYLSGSEAPWTMQCRSNAEAVKLAKHYENLADEARLNPKRESATP